MNKFSLFCLAGDRYGSLEVLLPILNELKNSDTTFNITVFFYKKSASHKTLFNDSILKKIFVNIIDNFYIKPRIYLPLILFFFYLKNILNLKKTILVAPFKTSNFEIKIIKIIPFLKFIGYPQTSTINVKLQKQFPIKQNFNFNFNGENGIGFPKFYKSWIDKFSKRKSNNDSNDTIVVFLPSIVNPEFTSLDFDEWINNIHQTIIKLKISFKCIMIKPHPMLSPEKISYVLDMFQQLNAIKTEDNSMCILKSANLVFTAHSSVILDCLYFEIPTIFYQKFSNHWLKRHNDGSKFLNLGAKYFDNKNDMIEYLLKDELENKSINERNIFLDKINHKNNLIGFLSKNNII